MCGRNDSTWCQNRQTHTSLYTADSLPWAKTSCPIVMYRRLFLVTSVLIGHVYSAFIQSSSARTTQLIRESIRHVHNKNVQPSNDCIKTEYVPLSSGVTMEIISTMANPRASRGKPPLLFIHGSLHAAWCWVENYLPHFSGLGYDSVAISLRVRVLHVSVFPLVYISALYWINGGSS